MLRYIRFHYITRLHVALDDGLVVSVPELRIYMVCMSFFVLQDMLFRGQVINLFISDSGWSYDVY